MLYRCSTDASNLFETLRRAGGLVSLPILHAIFTARGPLLQAQTGSASILGRITDQRDAIIPDADIQINNVDTGFTANGKSNGDGQYLFPFLNPGNYLGLQQTGFSDRHAYGHNPQHAGQPLPEFYTSDRLGVWERDTFVVETAGFNDKSSPR